MEDENFLSDCGNKIYIVPDSQNNPEVEYMLRLVELYDEQDTDQSMCVVNLSQVIQLYKDWCANFPNVRPYYALKCNYNKEVVRMLINLGCGIDCASEKEMQLALSLGAKSEDIIYHHPQKLNDHLRYAKDAGISLTVADCEEELLKIEKIHSTASVLIRLRSFNEHCDLPMGWKFGCTVKDAISLLDYAKTLGITIAGVCFHPGSGVTSPEAYLGCLKDSLELFKHSKSHGFNFTILDIGGGFPGSSEALKPLSQTINQYLQSHFKEFENLQIIAEPGRYFAMSPFTVAMRVIGKSSHEEDENGEMKLHYNYYFPDGIFGSFNRRDQLVDTNPIPLNFSLSSLQPTYSSTFYGPVCTDFDMICQLELPELKRGQWFYFENSGAYSLNLHTEFNGFTRPVMYYLARERDRKLILTKSESSVEPEDEEV